MSIFYGMPLLIKTQDRGQMVTDEMDNRGRPETSRNKAPDLPGRWRRGNQAHPATRMASSTHLAVNVNSTKIHLHVNSA